MFSVIMPVYNHAAFVGEAVQSVRSQTFTDWELVAVNDGSTDGSDKVLDALAGQDTRIVPIHQPNAGPARARNRGIACSRGQWVAFLDSDDVWYPQTLERYAAFIGKTPEARFIYGYWDRMADGEVSHVTPRYQDRPRDFADLFQHVFVGPSCVCIQRQLLNDAGGFDPELPPVEDYDLFLRLSLKAKLHPTAQPTGLRRRHDTNISRDCGKNRLKEATLLERYAADPAAASLLPPRIIARRLSQTFYAAGREYFRAHAFSSAIAPLQRALDYRFHLEAAGLLLLSRMLARRDKTGPVD